MRNRTAALIEDTSKDERWMLRQYEIEEKAPPRSAVSAPLLVRDRLTGVMTLVHPKAGFFTDDHLALVQAISDQASIAVLNARLYTESQRQARGMTALAEGASAMNASLRMDDVYQRILMQTVQALQVETAAIRMIEGDHLIYRAAAGNNAGNIIGRKIRLGDGIVGTAAREGRGVVVSNISQDKNYSDADRFAGVDGQYHLPPRSRWSSSDLTQAGR